MAESTLTGAKAVLKLRDEMLRLVNAYNAVGMYDDAEAAQRMAVALNQFEEAHVITNMAWPPRVVEREGYTIIEPAQDEGDKPLQSISQRFFCLHRDFR